MSPFEQRAKAAQARIDDALGLRPAKNAPPAGAQQPQGALAAATPQQGLAAMPQPAMPPQAPMGGLGALQGAR